VVAWRQHQLGEPRLSIPTFLQGKEIVITKTMNGGFGVSENKDAPIEQCVVFETWAALVYYLETNFLPPLP
jgi:hypothetical protein